MPHRILVVDDDHATRVGLVALLEQAGYDVIAADNLKSARQALAEQAPELLIADVRLGEFNGLHLAATNRANIPMIVITGYPDPVLESVARSFGAEFMLKPIQPAALLALVEQRLTTPSDTAFQPVRRWPRKRLTTEVPAQVDSMSVKVVDISYGGLSFAVPAPLGDRPPAAVNITFPTASLSLKARVVWEKASDASWIFGAMIADDAEPLWHQFVDATT
jgi:DNA-binding response OmpR family regulator